MTLAQVMLRIWCYLLHYRLVQCAVVLPGLLEQWQQEPSQQEVTEVIGLEHRLKAVLRSNQRS
jgi:hypothetical protein